VQILLAKGYFLIKANWKESIFANLLHRLRNFFRLSGRGFSAYSWSPEIWAARVKSRKEEQFFKISCAGCVLPPVSGTRSQFATKARFSKKVPEVPESMLQFFFFLIFGLIFNSSDIYEFFA
jgi:hypothetical protein